MTDRLEAAVAEMVAALRAELTPPPPAPDRLLSIDEAAELLGISRASLYVELGSGRLPSLKIARRRLIAASAIAERIAAARAP